MVVDRDEILIVGRVSAPEVPDDADEVTLAAAEAGRIARFREETRDERMAVAREAEHLYGRSIAWGAEAGATVRRVHRPLGAGDDPAAPAGTGRARHPGRQWRGPEPLDALLWCVKLVATNADAWLADLRAAMESVESVPAAGPDRGLRPRPEAEMILARMTATTATRLREFRGRWR